MRGGGRVSFKAVALNLKGGFKDVALNGGLVGGCFQGSSLEWRGGKGVGFKAVALNLEGVFKDVALNGGLVEGWFQGSRLEWKGVEGLVSRLQP